MYISLSVFVYLSYLPISYCACVFFHQYSFSIRMRRRNIVTWRGGTTRVSRLDDTVNTWTPVPGKHYYRLPTQDNRHVADASVPWLGAGAGMCSWVHPGNVLRAAIRVSVWNRVLMYNVFSVYLSLALSLILTDIFFCSFIWIVLGFHSFLSLLFWFIWFIQYVGCQKSQYAIVVAAVRSITGLAMPFKERSFEQRPGNVIRSDG